MKPDRPLLCASRFPFALLALGCLLGVSCGTGDVANPVDPVGQAGDSGERTEVLNEVLPLERLLVPSQVDYPLLDQAVNQLTAECMSASGYNFEPYPGRPVQRLLDLRARYGYLGTADAESGYRSTVPAGGPPEYLAEVERIDQAQQEIGGDYLEVLYGVNGDAGCRGRASTEIWGSPTGLQSVPGFTDILDLAQQSMVLLLAEPDAVEANSAWSKCMGDQGYRFDRWIDAPQEFLLPGSEVSVAEVDQATADAKCRELVSLEPILFEAETRIQDELIAASPFVNDFANRITSAVENAKQHDSAK